MFNQSLLVAESMPTIVVLAAAAIAIVLQERFLPHLQISHS